MLASQRHLFDIPNGVTYLNAAYMTPQLRSVTEAGLRAVRAKSEPWRVTPPDFFSDSEELRGLFATLVGGDGDGVALIPSVSYGVETAVANVTLSAGDEITVLDEQFPSNVYPWLELAQRTGASIVTVPRPRAGPWTDSVIAAITPRTRVVAVPNVHWTDGSRVDLAPVTAAAHEVDAVVVVDATQSLGAMPLDVTEARPDYLIAGGYKCLLGPYSLGYMWVAPEHRLGVPLEQNWIARAGSEDFRALVDYKSDYQPGARRFDVGERSNFVLVPMAIAAISQLVEWGPDAIAAYVSAITAQVEDMARQAGLDPIAAADRGPNLIGVRVPGGPPPSLAADLAAQDIFVSVRSDSIRVAAHMYTEPADVDRLFAELSRLL